MKSKNEVIQIVEDYSIQIKSEHISDSISNRDLFDMALRINKKRSFLFVSKLLGKHLPVMPQKALLTGKALTALFVESREGVKTNCRAMINQLGPNFDMKIANELLKNKYSLKEDTLILGFAETATGLGHSVFSAISDNAYYLHTTREKVATDVDPIMFYEEHSHATEHRIYSYTNQLFKSECDIVLVDDEISTGNTILNIIKAIQENYPRKHYHVLTILDWRNENSVRAFAELENELGIQIKVLQLAKGEFELVNEVTYDQLVNLKDSNENIISESPNGTLIHYKHENDLSAYSYEFKLEDEINLVQYLKWTGRFGVGVDEQLKLEEMVEVMGRRLAMDRKGKKTLCMGTGEFMYIPMLVASHMGEGVMFQSTTRSPILAINRENYGARNAFEFKNPFDKNQKNFFYNIHNEQYDDAFVFIEKSIENADIKDLVEALRLTGIKNVNIVTMT